MIYTTVTIKAPNGLNTRFISNLVVVANKFKSQSELQIGNDIADMKSLMNMLALYVQYNESISIRVEGEDEKEASAEILSTLKKLQIV
jgi:phosphocarrier protein HPr